MGKFLPDPEIDKLVQEMNRLVERDAETVGDDPRSIHDLDDPSLRVVSVGDYLHGAAEGRLIGHEHPGSLQIDSPLSLVVEILPLD